MSIAAAKLRSDLVVSRQGTPEKSVFVIKDPDRERFFRFGETEHFIAQQLDGATSPDTVRQRVEEKFDAPLPPETLQQFIDRLERIGLLEKEQRPTGGHSQGRIRGNIFYLRLKAFNPDRLLDWLVTRLKFFFTPAFVFLSASMIFLAACVTAANWFEIGRDFGRLYSFSSLVLAYLTMLAVITCHEFAHGLTCKNFGGSVREIGFLLLYFQPAFYCNVSDAWLFPEKPKRLWVTFAGAYFEIFIWALATLVWRVTDPYTLVHYLALVVVATSGIKTMFNLNPLIKLDGYYLLSDYLEVPNLRGRAFGYLGDRVRRLWGSAEQRVTNATPREKRIYWIYGLLAWSYSWWLLSVIALYIGGVLVRNYQGWGFIVFVVLLAGLFQQPLKKALRKASAGVKVGKAMSIWTKRLIRLGVLGVLVAALFFFRAELRVAGPFIVLPIHNADVRAEVEGILQEIYADEGNAVNKGSPIAALSERDSRAELRKTKAEIDEKQARLNLLRAGTRPEEIELARTLQAKAQERLVYSTNLLQMDSSLFEDKLISKREFEESKELAAVRSKELQESKDRLALLLAGSRKEDIEATEAEISRLQSQQRYLEEQLQLLKVLSPIDGIITTHKLKDKVGQAVKKGDLIAKVHAMKTVTVEIAIPEKEIADVSLGQKVVLKARAHAGTSFETKVTSIAPIATEPQEPGAERTVLVMAQLDNASLLLKPEMTGHAKISCGQQRLIDLISRRLIRFIKVEFWSWW
jgi:putative peptide zinc metalloprotease protein